VIVLNFEIVFGSVPDGRLFGLDAQTLIQVGAHLVNVSLLAFVLAKLLYRPVREFLSRRSERIRIQLEQAADDTAKATELKVQYEQKLKRIELEQDGLIEEARKRAAETARQILADAKTEADAIRERASANVEMEWEQAQVAMRRAIIDVSAAMSAKFVTLAINKDTHDRLFAETMSELEGMTWKN
jgi:F-type H+-transporting ATPase subunit b